MRFSRGFPLNTAPPPGWNGFDQRVFNRGTGKYGIKGNVEWSVLHRTFFCRHTILAPFNGARVRETKWRGAEDNKSLNVFRVWDVALCGPCLPHPPPTAGRGAAVTVPTPMPLAVPRFPSILLHGAGVRPRSIAKPWPGHTSTGNVNRRPSILPIPGQRFGCFARLQTKAHTHWLGRFASSFHCVSVVQLPLSSGREKLILCFGRRESCGPGAHRDDEREVASWTVVHYLRDCIGNVGVGAFFGAGGGGTLCSPIPTLWFLPPSSLWGTLGETILGRGGAALGLLGDGRSLGLGREPGAGATGLEEQSW